MTILLLVALVVWAVYLALRVRQLEHAVAALTRTVDKPQKRDRAIRKEIKELEDRLAFIGTLVANGAASPQDVEEADVIREKLERGLHRVRAADRGRRGRSRLRPARRRDDTAPSAML